MSGRLAMRDALIALLPSGPALPRDPGSPFVRLIEALGAELAEVTSRGRALLDEADPRSSVEMFEAWERMVGLPDECLPLARFSRLSTAPWIDGGGRLRIAAVNELRRLPDGRPTDTPLIEPARVNLVRNPRAEGAVAGSPGTAPTFWAFGGGGGASVQIVDAGSELGVPYVDFRITGPAGAGRFAVVQFDTSTSAVVAPGEVLAASHFIAVRQVVSGGVDKYMAAIAEFTAAGAYLGETRTTQPLITAARTRAVHVAGIANPSAVRAQSTFVCDLSAAATDVTIRLALPQLERGRSATSPILPDPGAPLASARAEDRLSIASAAERRRRVLSRLISRPGQSRAFFIGLAAGLGQVATITEFAETTCEMGCEEPVHGPEWRHAWRMNLPVAPATAEFDCLDGCETPLVEAEQSPIECVIRRFSPAHTTLLFQYA